MADRSLDELPVEMLQEVLSNLDWRQQMGVRRVSRRFRAAADACLARCQQLCVRGGDLGGHLSAERLEQVLQSMPAVRRLDVKGHSSTECLQADLVWRNCRQLEELRLKHLSVELSDLERLCDGSQCLSQADCSQPEPVPPHQLRELDLSVTRMGSGELAAVLPACPQLGQLAVPQCPLLGADWLSELRRSPQPREREVSDLTLLRAMDVALPTGLAGCGRLQRLATARDAAPRTYLPPVNLPPAALPSLTLLDLRYTYFSPPQLAQLLPELAPGLRDLRISRGVTLSCAPMASCLPRLRYLEVLDMRGVLDSASPLLLGSLRGLPLRALACGHHRDGMTADSVVDLVRDCPALCVLQLTVKFGSMVRHATRCLATRLPPDREVTFIVQPCVELGPLPVGALRVLEDSDNLWESLSDSQRPAK